MFGSRTDNVAFLIDGLEMKIETKNPTTTYSTVSLATMVISKIQNPQVESIFESFEIYVYDINKEKIAEITTGISFDSVAGDIVDVVMSIEDPMIDTESKLTFEFRPLHRIP